MKKITGIILIALFSLSIQLNTYGQGGIGDVAKEKKELPKIKKSSDGINKKDTVYKEDKSGELKKEKGNEPTKLPGDKADSMKDKLKGKGKIESKGDNEPGKEEVSDKDSILLKKQRMKDKIKKEPQDKNKPEKQEQGKDNKDNVKDKPDNQDKDKVKKEKKDTIIGPEKNDKLKKPEKHDGKNKPEKHDDKYKPEKHDSIGKTEKHDEEPGEKSEGKQEGDDKGNAYGKNKDELQGKDFGQNRAEQAKMKRQSKAKELDDSAVNGDSKVIEGREKIKIAKEKLEKEKTSKKISDADYQKRKEKIDNAEKAVNILEEKVRKARSLNMD